MSPTGPGRGTRAAGVLLHPTSLPGGYGIGDLGDELITFLDWAAAAGMRIWQVLPLNPPGYGNSPYNCLSSAAGNVTIVSPRRLVQEGLLPEDALADVPPFRTDHVDFDAVNAWKERLLRRSWEEFERSAPAEHRAGLERFESEDETREWLDEFALFMALKRRNGGVAWWDWPRDERRHTAAAMRKARRELAGEIRFEKYCQYLFFRQWKTVRDAAHERGIRILGDVPIYVASDSADVWANSELFHLDDDGRPTVVAGVPPDYFSATGQRWGNPIYRWDLMAQSDYRWWVRRIRASLCIADIVRLDHFRGFAAYWEIPAHEETAVHGRWVPGPGIALFDAIRKELGELPLIAEDLGFITQEVHDLRHATELAGMKILQFAFSHPDSPHMPHRYEPHTVVYTGTHDNDTACGWYEKAPQHDRAIARAYLGDDCSDFARALVRAAYTSVAETAIIPLQDILGLPSDSRMNIPGADNGNWTWRLQSGALTREHADRLRQLAELTGRL